jgi:hypothetical protein
MIVASPGVTADMRSTRSSSSIVSRSRAASRLPSITFADTPASPAVAGL